jgi:hypothetical protein
MSHFTQEDRDALDRISDLVMRYRLEPGQISLMVLAFRKGQEFERLKSIKEKNIFSESAEKIEKPILLDGGEK